MEPSVTAFENRAPPAAPHTPAMMVERGFFPRRPHADGKCWEDARVAPERSRQDAPSAFAALSAGSEVAVKKKSCARATRIPRVGALVNRISCPPATADAATITVLTISMKSCSSTGLRCFDATLLNIAHLDTSRRATIEERPKMNRTSSPHSAMRHGTGYKAGQNE